MESPKVESILRDEERGVTYVVLGYRAATREELLFAVRRYLQSKRGKHPKRGSRVTIISVLR